jgi:hypothetical protein
MDYIRQYQINNPSVDPVWFGTTAVGTQTQSKALVIINKTADYPRNAVYAVASAAGSVVGGSWVVNGKDQFGNSFTETVAVAPATGGGTVAGTKIFAEVTSGTFNWGTGDPGNGTPRLGVAIGTSATTQHWFGLPDKIRAATDVKSLSWINNGTSTTFNGGTVGTANVKANAATGVSNAFSGTAIVAITDRFVVRMKSSFAAEENVINSNY